MRALVAALMLAVLAACSQPAAGPDMAVVLADKPAAMLSDYGLFTDQREREPAAGVVKYDLINPLFSDYADKHRFVFVPDGQAASYVEGDVLDFPVGTVLVKTFAYGERYVETRLLIHKAEGWEAIPYVWNEAGNAAAYAPVGARIEMQTAGYDGAAHAFTYAVPNKNQCKTCHQNGDALIPIGPKARNLNHVGPHGVNQIADWQARGILTGVPDAPPVVPAAGDEASSFEDRARAYLDINCAHCHKPSGSASNSGLWLDWSEDDPVKIGIGKHPTAAGRGAGLLQLVIVPGDPDASILTFRMASGEAGIAMPELGRALIDEAGVELVRDWIAQMPAEAE